MARGYETRGRLYVVPVIEGEKGLIGLDYSDYQNLLATGIMDEEVRLSLRKATHGIEYEQGAPELEAKAGLYTIAIEGTGCKPQLDIDGQAVSQALQRGIRDGDEVIVRIEALPARNPRSASLDGLRLGLGF